MNNTHLNAQAAYYLYEAEKLFGPRIKGWDFCGVGFHPNVIDHPVCESVSSTKCVYIWLTSSVLVHQRNEIIELAHECVHLLSPSGTSEVTRLEEGVATWFATKSVNDQHMEKFTTKKYKDELQAVTLLLNHDENAIKKLRSEEPEFNKMTIATFKAANLDVPDDAIEFLLSRVANTG